MKSVRIIPIIFAGIVMSLFLFPIELSWMMGQNTKNWLAVVGAVILGIRMARTRDMKMDKGLFFVFMMSCLFAVAVLGAVVYNGTTDYTYVSYPATALIWMLAAYSTVSAIRYAHTGVSIRLIGNYVLAVCVAQCILAQLFDAIPAFDAFVQRYVNWGQDYFKEHGRLYGIGCALDPAGTRFAASLVICAYLIMKHQGESHGRAMVWYILAFAVITVLGNMIARTTILGFALALGSLVLFSFARRESFDSAGTFWKTFLILLVIVVPVVSFLYQTNKDFRNNLRFGFEGFFSLVETGHWETNSTNQLENMYVFPDNAKTWIIGDGYFVSPYSDIGYVGDDEGVFYKNTDVGVLRFIFYIGLIGLFVFAAYFYISAKVCALHAPRYKWMFFAIFLLNIIIWFKVATDLFLFFALFLVMGDEDVEEDEEDEEDVELEELEA